jgi:hypothetical protein
LLLFKLCRQTTILSSWIASRQLKHRALHDSFVGDQVAIFVLLVTFMTSKTFDRIQQAQYPIVHIQ